MGIFYCSTSCHINKELAITGRPYPHNPYSPSLSCIHTQFNTSHFSVRLVGRIENLNLPERESIRKEKEWWEGGTCIPAHTNLLQHWVVLPLLKRRVSISFCYQSESKGFTQRPSPMLLPLATGHAISPPPSCNWLIGHSANQRSSPAHV